MIILILFLTFNLYAATTGTLVISGFIPEILEISVSQVNSPLDLSVVEERVKIADVTELSNSPNGYIIRISSANSGFLKKVGGSATINYDLYYNGVLVDFNLPVKDVPFTNITNYSIIELSHGANLGMAGEYQDTLTLEIVGK